MSAEHDHDQGAPNPDPSMEDILASIRRILNEEEAKPPVATAPEPDVLELDHSMMLPETEPGHAAGPAPQPPMIAAEPEPPAAAAASPVPTPAPVVEPAPAPVPQAFAVPFPASPDLVAPAAAAAAAVSVGALMRTLATERSTAVHRGGPTIEDVVREEMRPLLKQWLDTHLPPMVERLVRAEIERVVGRMA